MNVETPNATKNGYGAVDFIVDAGFKFVEIVYKTAKYGGSGFIVGFVEEKGVPIDPKIKIAALAGPSFVDGIWTCFKEYFAANYLEKQIAEMDHIERIAKEASLKLSEGKNLDDVLKETRSEIGGNTVKAVLGTGVRNVIGYYLGRLASRLV